ncbi:MAG: hypothetical protein KBD37_01925 [Burkholderiales bacterium]|nr:hypothetical protein [Burkholderiales bacterium]
MWKILNKFNLRSLRLSLLLIVVTGRSLAVIPTIDQHQLATDLTTMSTYSAQVSAYLVGIGKAVTTFEQIQQLHGLQQVEAAGSAICELCSLTEEQQLQTYINNINGDLCSQFSWAMSNITGLVQNVTTISEIIQLFQTNPKAATIAMQQAAIQTQISTQNTIAQIQMLMVQQAQKQLAEQKVELQNSNDIYIGFKKTGL